MTEINSSNSYQQEKKVSIAKRIHKTVLISLMFVQLLVWKTPETSIHVSKSNSANCETKFFSTAPPNQALTNLSDMKYAVGFIKTHNNIN